MRKVLIGLTLILSSCSTKYVCYVKEPASGYIFYRSNTQYHTNDKVDFNYGDGIYTVDSCFVYYSD